MYADVDKKKIGKTLFPNWSHISSQNKKCSSYKINLHGTAVGIIVVVHLIIEFQ